jgi:DNA-binding transcriptional LysR family regulator
MNISTDLLEFFRLVYLTHSLSKAASLYPVSLSTASRMLQKLRDALGDELFYRSGNELFPTARATEIYPAVLRLLEDAEALSHPASFDPARYRKIITIGCLDLDIVSLFPLFLDELRLRAPGIRINCRQVGADFDKALSKGQCDFVFYPTTESYAGIGKQAVCQDVFVFICQEGSSLAAKADAGEVISAAEVTAKLDAQVTVPVRNTDNTQLGLYIEDVEHSAFKPFVWTPFFATLPFLLSRDGATFLPYQEACALRQHWPVRILGRLQSNPPWSSYLLWNSRFEKDPLHQWLRSLIISEIQKKAADVTQVPFLS